MSLEHVFDIAQLLGDDENKQGEQVDELRPALFYVVANWSTILPRMGDTGQAHRPEDLPGPARPPRADHLELHPPVEQQPALGVPVRFTPGATGWTAAMT